VGNLLKIGHQHQTRILLATNMGNAPGVRLAQPLKKYGGIASEVRRHRVGAIACLSLAYRLLQCNNFLWVRNASLTYLKQFPPAAPPYRALPGFGPHGGPGAWGGRLDVIHAVGRTGWSKNGAAREPHPCKYFRFDSRHSSSSFSLRSPSRLQKKLTYFILRTRDQLRCQGKITSV
jgi:hypothetical protein